MKKLCAVLLLTAVAAPAQNTILQRLFTNVTTSPATSAVVPTIGQVGHFVFVQLGNAPGHTCGSVGLSASTGGQLQGSFDKISWAPFGSAVDSTRSQFIGNGLWPYVRFYVNAFDNTNCVLSAWYSGTLGNSQLQSVQGTIPPGTYAGGNTSTDWPSNPLFMGGLGNSGALQPILLPNFQHSWYATIPAGTSGTVVTGNAVFQGYFNITGFIVTLSAAGTVQFGYGTGPGGTCTSASPIGPAFNLAAGVPLTAGGGMGALFQSSASVDLCLTATGGTAAAQAFVSKQGF